MSASYAKWGSHECDGATDKKKIEEAGKLELDLQLSFPNFLHSLTLKIERYNEEWDYLPIDSSTSVSDFLNTEIYGCAIRVIAVPQYIFIDLLNFNTTGVFL